MDMNAIIAFGIAGTGVAGAALLGWWALRDGPDQPPHVSVLLPTSVRMPTATAPVNADRTKLTHEQALVLAEMDEFISYPAAKLARYTGLPERTVTRVRKELRALGLAQYGTLRADGGESNEIAGRGYWLTDAGLAAKRDLAGEVVA